MKYILLAGVMLSSVVLMADDTKPFVGVEIGKAKGSYSFGNLEWDGEKQNTLGVKAGLVGKNNRMYVTYVDVDKYEIAASNYSEKYKALFASVDVMTNPYTMGGGILPQVFVGIHAGGAKIDATYLSTTYNDTDWIYGGQAGILLNVTPNLALEAGYRYSWTKLSIAGINLDNAKNYYAGLNFSF